MANATTDITDSNGRINNNLPKRIFRESAENKNLLAKAGSLYYGTGDTETVTIKLADGSDQTYQIPITKAVEPPIGGIKNDVFYGIRFDVRDNQTVATAQMIEIMPLVAGTYVWNDYLSEPSKWSLQHVNFESDSTPCTAIKWDTYKLYYTSGSEDILVYSYDEGEGPESGTWIHENYKTITFPTTPQRVSPAFYSDLTTNTTHE